MVAAVALLLTLVAQPAQAQVYELKKMPAPQPFTLSAHYLFYVYGEKDSPASSSGAQASMEFRKLAAQKTVNGQPPSNYDSLVVSILPYDRFWDLVNNNRFCSSSLDAAQQQAKRQNQLLLVKPEDSTLEAVGARTQLVPLGSEAETVSYPIKEAGKYILAISNCGNYSEATLTGSIAVRNAHGYLPAYEFNSMRIAGWSTVLYTAIFVVWTGAAVRHFKTLFYIQQGILVISFICLLEAFSTWVDHQEWNTTGKRRDCLFLASLMFYTLKYVLSWRLLLLAALGAGVVFEDLDKKTSIIFFLASCAFTIQSCSWKLIVAYRFSHLLYSAFLLLVTFPGILIYTGMFAWTFILLSRFRTRIKEQKQEVLAKMFGKVQVILAIGFLLSTINATLQVLDIVTPIFSWGFACLLVDGAPQYSFMAVLIAMMVVWWPNPDSLNYGYRLQSNDDDEEVADNAFNNKVAMEEDDDIFIQLDSRKPRAENKGNTVAPEAIGAPEAEREARDEEMARISI